MSEVIEQKMTKIILCSFLSVFLEN